MQLAKLFRTVTKNKDSFYNMLIHSLPQSIIHPSTKHVPNQAKSTEPPNQPTNRPTQPEPDYTSYYHKIIIKHRSVLTTTHPRCPYFSLFMTHSSYTPSTSLRGPIPTGYQSTRRRVKLAEVTRSNATKQWKKEQRGQQLPRAPEV